MSDNSKRLDFGHLVDQVFWGILVATALYASNKLDVMSTSINELNKTVAVIVQQNTDAHERLNNLDRRVNVLEGRRPSQR